MVEGSVYVEFDRSGLTDIAVKTGAKVQVGVNVDPESKEGLEIHSETLGVKAGIYEVTSLSSAEIVGVHTRMGWNASSGIYAKGGGTILGVGHH